jgi:hypothetical protein
MNSVTKRLTTAANLDFFHYGARTNAAANAAVTTLLSLQLKTRGRWRRSGPGRGNRGWAQVFTFASDRESIPPNPFGAVTVVENHLPADQQELIVIGQHVCARRKWKRPRGLKVLTIIVHQTDNRPVVFKDRTFTVVGDVIRC